jgi:hypothetical protein
MPPPYWAEALVTATYLLNRRPCSSVNNVVPYTILYNKTPDYSHLRVFGCLCYPNLSATTPHKLAPRSAACVFLGYPSSHKGYRCLNLTTRRVIISRHVVFNETAFPFYATPLPMTDMDFLIASNPAAVVPVAAPSPRDVERPRPSPVVHEEDPAILMRGPVLQELASTTFPSSAAPPPPRTTLPDAPRERPRVYARRPRTTPALPEYVAEPALPVVEDPTSSSPAPPPPPPEPRRVTRTQSGAIPPVRYVGLSATATTPASPIPGNYRSGLADPNWRAAMAEEYQALIDNGTWRLVPRPPGANVVSGKWIFKQKYHSDGTLARHKARWVVRGFSQQHGIDYDETFSPVVKHPTIRTVLSIAASRSWYIRQLDVKNAFLHGHLEETVYCQQPPGFIDLAAPDHVCLLQRSLYGLKQAPRAWYQRFATYIRQLGFTASSDVSLFVYKEGESLAYLLLYVDDIILTASSTDLLQRFIILLHSEFAMTDLGDLHHFLNISVTCSSDEIFLSQRQYTVELLQRAGMAECHSTSTLVDTHAKLSATDGAPIADPSMYRSIADALQYITLTRPDLAYAVQQGCLFMHDSREPHLALLKRILRYLKGTLSSGLHLGVGPVQSLTAYSDADWAGCPDSRRSALGWGSSPGFASKDTYTAI